MCVYFLSAIALCARSQEVYVFMSAGCIHVVYDVQNVFTRGVTVQFLGSCVMRSGRVREHNFQVWSSIASIFVRSDGSRQLKISLGHVGLGLTDLGQKKG